jgi:DNA polymerase-1
MELDIMWDAWTATRTLNVAAAWQSVRGQIKSLMQRFQTGTVVFCLSGAHNWRKDVFPDYKANRAAVKKPCGYAYLRELALAHPATVMHGKLEADDLLGVRGSNPAIETIIVSSDKDMQSIPGKLYNPTKDVLRDISPEEADLFHATQTLTGDTSDGYKGCPGMGPVKVEKLFAGLAPADRWPAIVAAYTKAGLNEEEALTQARIARILRHGEFNFKTGVVNLWKPKI